MSSRVLRAVPVPGEKVSGRRSAPAGGRVAEVAGGAPGEESGRLASAQEVLRGPGDSACGFNTQKSHMQV